MGKLCVKGIRYCIYSCKYVSDRATNPPKEDRTNVMLGDKSCLLFLLEIVSEKSRIIVQLDALPPFIFF